MWLFRPNPVFLSTSCKLLWPHRALCLGFVPKGGWEGCPNREDSNLTTGSGHSRHGGGTCAEGGSQQTRAGQSKNVTGLYWPSSAFFCCTIPQLTDLCLSVFQNAMVDLKSELQDLQHQFEESLSFHQSTKTSLTEQLREFSQQREEAKQEVELVQIICCFSSAYFSIHKHCAWCFSETMCFGDGHYMMAEVTLLNHRNV